MINKRLRNTALFCWFGWVLDFYDLILIVFLIPVIEASLHIAISESAWLIGVGLGASGLGGMLFGWLADSYGRRSILILCVFLFSIGMLFTAFTQNATQFMLARFITGLGLGGEWAVGHALLAESVPHDSRGRWGAFLQSGEPIGAGLAAIVGFLLAPKLGWRTIFIGSSLAGFAVLTCQHFLHESPLWLNSIKLSSKERFRKLKPFFKNHALLMGIAFILAVLKLGTYWTSYTWLPRFIKDAYGEAVGKSALWILSAQLGQFIGMHIFGFMADRIGRRFTFTVFSLLTASMLFFLASFWTSLFTDSKTSFWIIIFLLGIGSGCTAGFGPLLSEIFPTQERTFAMATVYNLARSLQILAPVTVGMAVEKGGIFLGLLIPTILAILTALWVWMLPERKGISLTKVE